MFRNIYIRDYASNSNLIFPPYPCPSPHLKGWVGQGRLKGIVMKASSILWKPSRTPGLATQTSATIPGGTGRGLPLYYYIKEIKNGNTLELPHPTEKKILSPWNTGMKPCFCLKPGRADTPYWDMLISIRIERWQNPQLLDLRWSVQFSETFHSSLSIAVSPPKVNSNPYVRRSSCYPQNTGLRSQYYAFCIWFVLPSE